VFRADTNGARQGSEHFSKEAGFAENRFKTARPPMVWQFDALKVVKFCTFRGCNSLHDAGNYCQDARKIAFLKKKLETALSFPH
jgi:hypothetical protein